MTKETKIKARQKGYKSIFISDYSIQKWLRNKHKINININHRTHSQSYYFTITGSYYVGEYGLLYSDYYTKYASYEIALEKAVEEALEYLKLN